MGEWEWLVWDCAGGVSPPPLLSDPPPRRRGIPARRAAVSWPARVRRALWFALWLYAWLWGRGGGGERTRFAEGPSDRRPHRVVLLADKPPLPRAVTVRPSWRTCVVGVGACASARCSGRCGRARLPVVGDGRCCASWPAVSSSRPPLVALPCRCGSVCWGRAALEGKHRPGF